MTSGERRAELAAWKRFFAAEGQVLSSHPHLLFQQAHNQPGSAPVAHAAAARSALAPQQRPWIRWSNKPAAADPCLFNLRGHLNTVTCVLFSPDGRNIVSAGWEDIIRVWDADTGQLVAELIGEGVLERQQAYGPNLGVLFCAYSPDGRQLVSVHHDEYVRLWNADTWTQIGQFEANQPKTAAWLAPGTLVIAARNVDLQVVQSSTGEYIERFQVPAALSTQRRSRMSGSCFLASGAGLLLAACAEKAIGAWSLESRQLEFTLETGPVSAWTGAPDASWVAVGGDDGTLSIWDLTERKAVRTFAAHAKSVEACAVSPDGTRLVTGADKELKLWDTQTWNEAGHLAGHSLFIQACAWSPRGDRIAAGAGLFQGGEMRVWTATAEEWKRERPRHSSVVGVATFSPDGRHVVSGTGWSNESGDRRTQTELQVWDVESGQLHSTVPVLGGPDVTHCLFPNARGEFISTSGGGRKSERTVDVWPLGADRPRFTRQGVAEAVSPNGRYVVGGSPLEIWDLDTDTRVSVLEGISGARFCAFTPDGAAIVGITAGGNSARWELDDGGRLVAESPAGPPDLPEMASGAMSPDGSLLARAWRGGALDLVDARSLAVTRTLAAADPSVLYGMHLCAFSPDGRLLVSSLSGSRTHASGDSGAVVVWSVQHGRRIWRETGSVQISRIVWSADGRLLIVGSADGVVRLLTAETGREVARFFTRTVLSALSVSPRGYVLAAGDRDGYLHLLSLQSGIVTT